MNIDTQLFQVINGWSGHSGILDEIIKGLASDYFLLVGICLLLVFWWFGTLGKITRESTQRMVLIGLIALGFANGLVKISNLFFFRVRPGNALPDGSVHLLFYRPTDSSFPSNFAAVLTAVAITVLMRNRKWGLILLAIALIGGFSRVYVGVHYPLDILGGMAAGALASFAAYGVGRLIEPLTAFLLKLLRQIHLA